MNDIHKQNDSPGEPNLAREDLNQAARQSERDGAGQELKATHYAYDPQTYEILCCPGQPLREKKARRLQELNLYEHVVRFTERDSP